MAQLRKAADRKRVHRGQHSPRSLHDAAAELPLIESGAPETNGSSVRTVAGIEVHGDGPMVVREKVHPAVPMSLDQALLEMELVGSRLLSLHRLRTHGRRASSTVAAPTTTA